MIDDCRKPIASILRQQRISRALTLRELARKSGVSPAHLGRLEQGKRIPTAKILRQIAEPLGFDQSELFMLAGYLSGDSSMLTLNNPHSSHGQLDPWVAATLSQEPVQVQHAAIGILNVLKILVKTIA